MCWDFEISDEKLAENPADGFLGGIWKTGSLALGADAFSAL
jgi:hypothetical protein